MNRNFTLPMGFRRVGVCLALMVWGLWGLAPRGAGAQEIVCRPPGSEAARAIAAQINTKTIATIVQGSGSFETKVQRIRNVSPRGADFDIIAYRLCEAVKNKLMDREFYQKFLLTAMQPGAAPAGGKWNLSGDVYIQGKRNERLENVELELGFEPPRVTTTAPDGTFSFAMNEEDAGRAVVLRARKPGYEVHVGRVLLKPNMAALQIPLAPLKDTFALQGSVSDLERNRPLPQAQVTLHTEPLVQAQTQSDGRFLLNVQRENLEKFVTLRVEQQGYRPFARDIRLAENMKPVAVVLQRATFVLSGISREKGTQKPLEGVRLTLMTEPTARGVSRSNGGFLLRVPERYDGEFILLRAEKDGYKTFTVDVELRRDRAQPVEVEMSLLE